MHNIDNAIVNNAAVPLMRCSSTEVVSTISENLAKGLLKIRKFEMVSFYELVDLEKHVVITCKSVHCR